MKKVKVVGIPVFQAFDVDSEAVVGNEWKRSLVMLHCSTSAQCFVSSTCCINRESSGFYTLAKQARTSLLRYITSLSTKCLPRLHYRFSWGT